MFYSERCRLLFVACPKTGTMSVHAALENIDPDGERFRIPLPDVVVDSASVNTDTLGHATAPELRAAMGDHNYRETTVFGFIRHPIEKLVSSYFFTRKQSLFIDSGSSSAGDRLRLLRLNVRRAFSVLAARLLPFSVWTVFFPMKTCSSYFVDSSGVIIVDYLGATDRLHHDLVAILNDIGLDTSAVEVPKLNKSIHSGAHTYVAKGGSLHRRLSKRYADDLKLYELVKSGYFKSAKAAILAEAQGMQPTTEEIQDHVEQ